MKVLISIDEHVYFYKGHYYVRELGMDLIDRYLRVFDIIRVAVRVDVVAELDVSPYRQMDSERVEIFPLRFFRGYKEFIQSIPTLRGQYKKVIGNCDAAIVRLPSTIGFSIAARVARKKLPLGCEVVANPYDFFRAKTNLLEKILYGIYHIQQKIACAKADGVAYVTKFNLQQHYPASKKGSFTTHYSSAKLTTDFYTRPRNTAEKDSYVLCHVAHPINNKEKGHEVVVRVVAALNKRLSKNVIVRFAGDGELVPELKQLALQLGIADKVEFPGLLSMKDMHQFLCDADLMIFPTLTEGLPRVVIEAMATGMPCVSTPVGGIPELLSKDSLFSPTDVKGFTERIASLLSDPELYYAESKQNFERSLEYEEEKLQERRINFFRKVCELVVE